MGSIQIFPLAEKCSVQSYLNRTRQGLTGTSAFNTFAYQSRTFRTENFPLFPYADKLLLLSMNQQCFTQIATVKLALLFIGPLIFSPEGSFLIEE